MKSNCKQTAVISGGGHLNPTMCQRKSLKLFLNDEHFWLTAINFQPVCNGKLRSCSHSLRILGFNSAKESKFCHYKYNKNGFIILSNAMVEGKKVIKNKKILQDQSKTTKIPYDGLFCFDELAVTSDLDSRLGCFQINEQ